MFFPQEPRDSVHKNRLFCCWKDVQAPREYPKAESPNFKAFAAKFTAGDPGIPTGLALRPLRV